MKHSSHFFWHPFKCFTSILGILVLLSVAASAQQSTATSIIDSAEAAGSAVVASISFLGLLMQGGRLIMIPLAILSFVAVLLVIFYFLTIRQGTVVSGNFMNSADALIRKQDYLGLIAVCNRQNESIAHITFKTLDFATKNPTTSLEEVREVAEAEGTRQASILNQRISYLADIGSIAPMVGLLGTVIGMIRAFRDMGVGAAQMELAPGVSQALITTASGLVIGIPALIFYSLFRGRVQKLIGELEAATTHLMALIAAQYKRSAARHQAQGTRSFESHENYEPIAADYPLGGARDDPRGL
ncbi:MAG: MotA/TolQ/ExbB proton channel family protein [Verrucomicrobiales bacterium]